MSRYKPKDALGKCDEYEIINLNALYNKNNYNGLDIVLFEVNSNFDNRGELTENFKQSTIRELTNQDFNPKQQNLVQSRKNVFRGIHNSKSQNKLVSCINGAIIDISVDLRKDSRNFGSIYTALLTESNRFNLFVPKGFGHGYYCLSDKTKVSYLLDGEYESNFEETWNATQILNRIEEIDQQSVVMSTKDKSAKKLFLD